jgi:hypothetical protein
LSCGGCFGKETTVTGFDSGWHGVREMAVIPKVS